MTEKPVTRRRFLRYAGLTAGAAALAACSAPAAPTQEAPAADAPAPEAEAPEAAAPSGEKQAVTLSMWTHDNLYVQFFGARAADQEFKDAHPNVEITTDFQQVPDTMTKMLSTLSAGEKAPDLFGIEQGWFGPFMKDDIIGSNFVDLTPLIGDERKNFFEGNWSKFTANGKLYGVDSSLCACAYYFQPAVLEKLGMTELPATWEDFMVAGEAAADQGVALSALDGEGSGIFYLMFLQRGGSAFSESNEFILEQPEQKTMFLEVMGYLQDGVNKKVFQPFTGADFWGPGIHAAHKDGKVMGEPGADWWSDYILKTNAADQSGDWRIAALPMWKGGGHTTSSWGGTGFSITKDSPNKELAWDLIHYAYMTKENQIKRYLEIKYYPHMLEALQDPQVASVRDAYYGDQEVGQVWAAVATDLPLLFQSPVRGDFETELGTQCTLVYKGEQTPEGAFDQCVKVTKQAIEDL
jgi:multiple sugar transport system substrate-binding protein/arabinosaccharide transport system substrate-binding protein